MSNIIVREILSYKRGIYKVKTDEGAFFVTEAQMVTHHIYKQATLTSDLISKIKAQYEEEVCYQAAMRLLVRRDHFKRELIQKLLYREYSDSIIKRVIERLSADCILNETAFAMRLANEKLKDLSKVKVKQYLIQKGCPTDIVEMAVICDDDEERQKAYLTLLKKVKMYQRIDSEKTKVKLLRHLTGKGFSYRDAKYAYQKLLEATEINTL